MRVVKKMLYPRIKILSDFDPKYATIVEPATHVTPGTIYIDRIDGWWVVFKKTKDGKIRRGGYKALINAVSAALFN